MSLSANYPTLRPSLLLDFVNAAVLSPRVTFTRASSATYFDQLGVLQTASNDVPRFDFDPSTLQPRGLLIEEQRTNSIRNNTMQGAVAGTPGTLPTNWGIGGVGLGTVTQEIVGTGTSNGITYIDIKFSGTTSTVNFNVGFEATTQIAALSGQTWTQSAYVAIVGGSITNITNLRFLLEGRNSGGITVESFLSAGIQGSLTSALQRLTLTSTFADATTAFARPTLRFDFSSGAAIDITLRIGLPQLEQGAFATSVIPTTTAAATRSADVASMTGANFSSWFNSTQGTVCAELMRPSLIASTAFANAWSISDNTADERYLVYNTGGSQTMDVVVTDGGVGQATLSAPGVITTNSQIKTAFAYAANDFAWVRDAGVVQTDTSGTLPTVDRLYIGANHSGAGQWNGWIRRIAYYPSRLTNAQLQALTAS